MSKNQIKILGFMIWSWIIFRLTSDWPRGLYASGYNINDFMLNLSYIGLVIWISMAIPLVISTINAENIFRSDGFAKCNMLFIFYQFFSLVISYEKFGNEGILSGSYILLVSISFLLIYIISKEYSYNKLKMFRNADLYKIASAVIFCAAPSIMIGLWQVVSGGGRDMGGYQRIFGGTSSPNVMAACMLVLLCFVVPLINASRSKVLTYGSIFSIIVFFACFSMTGIFVGLIVVSLYMIFKSISERKISVAPIVFLFIFASIFFIVGGDSVTERLSELDNNDNSLTWRLRTWDNYLYLFDDLQFLLFGGGLGFDHLGVEQEPHNEWLRTMMESGALGVSLYGFVWIAAISKLWSHIGDPKSQSKRLASGILAGVVGILIWSLLDSVLRTAPSALLLFLTLGIFSGLTERRGVPLR